MISFVILTVGDKPEKLNNCINSINRACLKKTAYEICVVGNNIPRITNSSVILIEDQDKKEFLGARKNIGTKNTKGEVLVHCDDDIIFCSDWFENFHKYSNSNPKWRIMGNKVLLPDGSRYWDRATYYPAHKMVDYDFYSDDVTFYQSGAFSISKRSLLEKISWSNDIPYYGMFKGFKHNEDVEFSLRLKENKIHIDFDKHNTVWHDDFTYASNDIVCNKRQNVLSVEETCLNFIIDKNL